MGRADWAKKSVVAAALIGLAIAAALHGMYDFMVLLQPYSALPCAALLVVVVWVWRLRLMRRLHRQAAGASTELDP